MTDGIGLVETEYYTFDELVLECGYRLSPVTLAYETYGKLNSDKSNVILICHALSGDAHAAGWHEGEKKPGWWDNMIGPGRAFDTEKFAVICSNLLGGCKGSTGPSSIDPETGKPYGAHFPVLTIGDMVNAQKRLIDFLGIKQLFAVVGGSMGGMQVLQWCVSYPDMVRLAIPIATTARSSPMQIAFDEVGRRAIMSDSNWNDGDYYDREPPKAGLALARMVGHITYLSDDSMREKFGRKLQDKESYGFDFSTDFQVESYLHYKGDTFIKRFDANSYLYITKAMGYFDLTRNNSLAEGFKGVKSKFLVISITSDWLYPSYQSKELVMALHANNIDVTYCELNSNYGHDAFLLETGQITYVIKNFLSRALVKDVMLRDVPVIREDSSIEDAARMIITTEFTHLPVISKDDKLVGIITAWDISKAVATRYDHIDEIMTKGVITSELDETIGRAAKKLASYNISALPVIDEKQKVIGIITSDCISKLMAGGSG